MGKFSRNSNGDTIQASPVNEYTEEGIFTDKSALNIDTIRALATGTITFQMRSGKTIILSANEGEDFSPTEDVISFSTSANVRIA